MSGHRLSITRIPATGKGIMLSHDCQVLIDGKKFPGLRHLVLRINPNEAVTATFDLLLSEVDIEADVLLRDWHEGHETFVGPNGEAVCSCGMITYPTAPGMVGMVSRERVQELREEVGLE